MNSLFSWARIVLPKISKTERIALQSGTVGLDRLIFSGEMNKDKLKNYKINRHTEIDKEMISRIPKLIDTLNDVELNRNICMPKTHEFWSVCKENKFFSLIFPSEYGGMPMSKTGLSDLLQRLASHSAVGSIHVMVPNSLGPGELLTHYGSERQKNEYLPRLSAGEIPCFGLTSPEAGSDAAGSMTDFGDVYLNDNNEVRIRITCNKRYITLAPVADIIGLAFKLNDPNGLLKRVIDEDKNGEITLALIERDTEGLEIGNCHDPLGVGFANGTIRGTIDIGIEQVIGEEKGLGEGWKMLMECLAAGRGIALPASAAGSSKMLANTIGAYTNVRKQFNMPISKFEGVREKLANITLRTIEIDASVTLMNSILDNNEQPPVLSAILKYRTTECSREVLNNGMDILGGSGICRGSQNFIAPAYIANPIGITVEGSNTLTRSMITFGQGVNRSHPYIDNLVTAIQDDDKEAFKSNVYKLVKMNVKNMFPTRNETQHDKFMRFFSLSSNLSLLLGGSLKKMEYLSGRYADLLSDIYYGYALEWYFEQHELSDNLLRVMQKDLNDRMYRNVEKIIYNHPHSSAHNILKCITIGKTNKIPQITDGDIDYLASQLTEPTLIRKTFSNNILLKSENIKLLNTTFSKFLDATTDPDDLEDIRRRVIAVNEYDLSNNSSS